MDATFKVNGRKFYPDHLRDFVRVSRGKYIVTRNETVYRIEGGKHLGGRHNDWFVECDEWVKPIVCNSVFDALRMLDGM